MCDQANVAWTAACQNQTFIISHQWSRRHGRYEASCARVYLHLSCLQGFTGSLHVPTNVCMCVPEDSQLVSLAEACWSKVLLERQHVLEENCKMEISVSHKAEAGPASMSTVSPLWEEMAHKAWLLHTGSYTDNCRERICLNVSG